MASGLIGLMPMAIVKNLDDDPALLNVAHIMWVMGIP